MNSKLKLLSAAVMLAVGSAANAGTIDLFETDQAQIQVSVTEFNTNNDTVDASAVGDGVDPTILGGYRKLYSTIQSTDGANPPTGGSRTTMEVDNSLLSFGNDPGVDGFGAVVWDGTDTIGLTALGAKYQGTIADIENDINKTGLGGVDLTQGGTVDHFVVETISADADWQFTILAYTDEDNWTKITFDATAVPTGTGPVISSIDFAGFTDATLCGLADPVPGVALIECAPGNQVVDFSNLGALAVFLNVGGGAFDIDLRLGSVTTNVPEPSLLGLLGLGLLAAGYTKITRRKNEALAA